MRAHMAECSFGVRLTNWEGVGTAVLVLLGVDVSFVAVVVAEGCFDFRFFSAMALTYEEGGK